MKLFYTAIFAILFHCTSSATTWNVNVANFSFSPATVNAVIGDVIQFTWVSGIHTTTCGSGLPGTSLPAGAVEWNANITAANPTFSYTITTAGNYLYGCVPHFGFGMQGNIVVSGPLPVALGTFSVANNNDTKGALLQWNTFSEINTQYYSIRKSTDGTNFYEIGRVNAAGNSAVTKSYQFADTDLGGIYKYIYFVIVIVDADKKESFSAIKTLRNGGVLKDNIIVSISPNPITRPGQVQLKFNADKAGEMNVSVFTGSGQLVLKTKMAAFYGLNSGHLHICDLNKGTYNIVFMLGGKTETKRVVVL